jgi:hypothetical protein
MAGRALRPHESIAHRLNDCPSPAIRRSMVSRSVKPSALIIDFVGNSGRHKLMTTANILGGNASDDVIEAVIAKAKKSGAKVRMDKSIEDEEKRIEEKRKRELAEQSRKAKLVGKSKYSKKVIDPFDILDIRPVQPRGWHEGKQITEGMKRLLKSGGIDDADSLGYSKASQMCGIIKDRWAKGLCSIKQAKTLGQFGCDINVSFKQASEMIDAIASNGWKRPASVQVKPGVISVPRE